MRITRQATDEAILRELGARIERTRLERNLTQARLAEEAGISKRTLERIESGGVGANLSAFLRVCRAFDVVERLEALLPEVTVSPMTQLKLQGRKRQRASRPKPPSTKPSTWTWGDEG
jgi:transcriptional regulator with XRE-family HTH domain